MDATPEIVTRPEQPYIALRKRVTMSQIPELGARFPEVFAWLGAHGLAPAGAPFFKYNVIDMAAELEMEAGVPVAAVVEGDDSMVAGVLPPGRYATVTCFGHPKDLAAPTGELLDWGAAQGLKWDTDGDRWGCRLEIYLTDPSEQPDMNKWDTQLAFRLAD